MSSTVGRCLPSLSSQAWSVLVWSRFSEYQWEPAGHTLSLRVFGRARTSILTPGHVVPDAHLSSHCLISDDRISRDVANPARLDSCDPDRTSLGVPALPMNILPILPRRRAAAHSWGPHLALNSSVSCFQDEKWRGRRSPPIWVTFSSAATLGVDRIGLPMTSVQAVVLETLSSLPIWENDQPRAFRSRARQGADNRGSPFIVTANITGDVRRAIDKCRWRARPYVLRRYFETQLFNASWKGLVPRDWITFWAGHQGDIEAVYTLHKGLPDGLIEDMRGAYAKAEPYLSTVSLKPEGREIYATDVGSERIELTAPIPNPEWAEKTNEEKLLAFMVKAVQENDVLKAALREALREQV